ncbi:MAG: tetratricopeptide repeat protein [Candidatus Cloacimonetes bacterium]|nr:tetratricopeptide repeat protein [Candidatus Cloacimonadota bacterium]
MKCPTECEYHADENENLLESRIKADSLAEYYDFIDKHTYYWLVVRDKYIPAEKKQDPEGKKEIEEAFRAIKDRKSAEIYEKHLGINLNTEVMPYTKSFEDVAMDFLQSIGIGNWELVRLFFSHKDPVSIEKYIERLKNRKEIKDLAYLTVLSSGTSQDGDMAFSSIEVNYTNDFSIILVNVEGDWKIDNVIFGEINLIYSENDTIKHIAHHLQTKEYDRAFQLIKNAEEIYYLSSDIQYNKGLYYSLMGENENALKAFAEATALDVSFSEAYFNQAFIHHSHGNVDEAKVLYEKVIALQPNNVNSYNNLGTIYLFLKDYEKAKNYFEKCLELVPEFKYAEENLKRIEELKKTD